MRICTHESDHYWHTHTLFTFNLSCFLSPVSITLSLWHTHFHTHHNTIWENESDEDKKDKQTPLKFITRSQNRGGKTNNNFRKLGSTFNKPNKHKKFKYINVKIMNIPVSKFSKKSQRNERQYRHQCHWQQTLCIKTKKNKKQNKTKNVTITINKTPLNRGTTSKPLLSLPWESGSPFTLLSDGLFIA